MDFYAGLTLGTLLGIVISIGIIVGAMIHGTRNQEEGW